MSSSICGDTLNTQVKEMELTELGITMLRQSATSSLLQEFINIMICTRGLDTGHTVLINFLQFCTFYFLHLLCLSLSISGLPLSFKDRLSMAGGRFSFHHV